MLCPPQEFQSLSRDSGRLNQPLLPQFRRPAMIVSIPQSGFGAFELRRMDTRTAMPPSFNPSVGIRGV